MAPSSQELEPPANPGRFTAPRRGIFAKIVFALFAPSRNAKRKSRANFRVECLTPPLATKSSAQLQGGLVMMLSADYLGSRKSNPTSPYPRSYKSEPRTG